MGSNEQTKTNKQKHEEVGVGVGWSNNEGCGAKFQIIENDECTFLKISLDTQDGCTKNVS